MPKEPGEPKIENEGKADIVANLQMLRNEWSDEIPKEILQGDQGENPPQYKVRKNWWHGLISCISYAVARDMLPQDISKDVSEFIREFASDNFRDRLTTAEDITKANVLIDKILESQKEK
jgi:hypothetical protein